MSLDQKRARWFGVLFLITFATSIPALLLYQPVLDDPVGYIAGAGHHKQILFGALLELLLIIANIGTAVVIVPIMRRQFEELSIGYVTARLFECMFILVGIVAVLGIVTLRNEAAGANEGTIAYTLAAIKDWTFLLGPGWVVGWGNGLILGYLMYRTQLVPRPWPWLGLIGGPLISTRHGHPVGRKRSERHCARCRASSPSRKPHGNSSSASTAPSGVSGGVPDPPSRRSRRSRGPESCRSACLSPSSGRGGRWTWRLPPLRPRLDKEGSREPTSQSPRSFTTRRPLLGSPA